MSMMRLSLRFWNEDPMFFCDSIAVFFSPLILMLRCCWLLQWYYFELFSNFEKEYDNLTRDLVEILFCILVCLSLKNWVENTYIYSIYWSDFPLKLLTFWCLCWSYFCFKQISYGELEIWVGSRWNLTRVLSKRDVKLVFDHDLRFMDLSHIFFPSCWIWYEVLSIRYYIGFLIFLALENRTHNLW